MQNYRNILKDYLAQKQKLNPLFSLRSMAKKLNITPSMLSSVMKGDKNLSLEKAYAIADKIELSQRNTELFLRLVELERAKDPSVKERIYQSIQNSFPDSIYIDLSIEKFKVVSEWFHFAILEVTLVSRPPKNSKEIAERLGLSVAETELAIERLMKLGMLAQLPDSSYKKATRRLNVSQEQKSESLRAFHRQTLNKAIESIDTQTNTEKFIGSETFVFSESHLGEAKEILEDAFTKLLKLAEGTTKDDVYHLGIQLFKFSKKSKEDRRLQ